MASRTLTIFAAFAVLFIVSCTPGQQIVPPQAPPPPGTPVNTAGQAAYAVGEVIPSDFAPPWDVFHSNAQVMKLSVSEPYSGSGTTLTIDQSASNSNAKLVYNQIWIQKTLNGQNTNQWNPLTMTGTASRYSGFLTGTVSYSIPASSLGTGVNIIAAYYCTDIVPTSGGLGTPACGCTSTSPASCGKWNIQRVTVQYCGDGAKNGAEACDGGTSACAGLGSQYLSGTAACKSDCSGWDNSTCGTQTCGDGAISGSEVCDGTNLNGKTCVTQGFTGGTLACSGCSALTTSGCWKTGDGMCDSAKGESYNNSQVDCISAPSQPQNPGSGGTGGTGNCVDPDNSGSTGANMASYSMPTTVTKGTQSSADSCTKTGYLVEYYCDGGGNILSTTVACPSGQTCSNGACGTSGGTLN